DLVEHEQHVALAAQRACRGKVSRRRHDDAGLCLYWLHEERNGLRRDGGAQRGDVAEVDEREARRERAEVLAILRLRRETDDRRRAAVEVVAADDDLGAVLRDAFDSIAPLARELDRRLDGLGAGIHRQRHLHAGERAELAQERAHAIVVHGARRQRQPLGLLDERRDDARVSMPLIQARVRADAIEILSPFDVEDPHAFAAADDYGQRRVVRRADALGFGDDVAARGHSVYLSEARERIWSPNRLCTSSTASSAVRLPSSYAGFSSMTSSERMSPES